MIKIHSDRSCGECTMCCQGHLTGTAHSYDFSPGKPCHWIRKNGCGIYPYRPDDPCKSFKCEWKINDSIPESFRPDKINAIFVKRLTKDNKYRLDVVEAGQTLSIDILNLALRLFHDKQYDAIYYEYKNSWYKVER